MVIWVTGLSGAGKTTLCTTLYERIKPAMPELVILDGDVVRRAYGNDLTHCEADRVRQVKRLRAMASVLAEQNLVVLVAVLYAHPDLLAWNRENLPGYFEVYLDVSLETVMERDDKGIYAAARRGEMPDVVGLDIPWYAPENPDLRLDGDSGRAPELLADEVIRAVPRLSNATGPAAGQRLGTG